MAPVVLEPPTPRQTDAIRREFGMTDKDAVRRDVATLRGWLATQPHLPADSGVDDNWLERYLTFCKNSVERAKRSLDLYYTVRSAVPEFFNERDPLQATCQQNMQVLYAMPLPRLTPEGYRVHLYAHRSSDVSQYWPLDFIRVTLMIAEVRLQEDMCIGNIIIFDLKDSRLGHVAKYTPSMLRKFIVCAQNVYPTRLTQIHFINVPSFIDKIMALVRPLIKEKLNKRMMIHTGGVESLLDHVPLSVLPTEYGGEVGSLQDISEAWREKLKDCRNWLIARGNLRTDESKRPKDSKRIDQDLFGCPGSFRQLAVD